MKSQKALYSTTAVPPGLAGVSPVRRILNELDELARLEGVRGVTVVSKDGFVIDAVVPATGINKDAVAAMDVSIFDVTTKFSREFNLSDLNLLTGEYANSMPLVLQ